MGRLAWYTGISTALAAGVVVSAFNQRVNFYSACVYLAQSNLCLMILINLILFIYGSFMYGLQRLCYGELRPIEIEQLYEKAWFAITETCLAMTIFREEVGAWFLVMFVALLTGKVWGWIGDGRVEVLEQQPPANPRLFHIRLSVSLAASILYDAWMMSYIINSVIQQARPNMMVMFLFEFAILTTASMSTGFRYTISLIETRIVGKQTRERLVERRREVREERAEMIRQREIAIAAAAAEGNPAPEETEPLPNEEDVDEMDIEVPGWEAKGQWILTLALCTDFVKLAIYCTFFIILLMFYGLPIHIMRDLFMTTRSFIQRLTAFLRYRKATQDMNNRYPDASVEDIERENTCIICREDMRPWSVTNPEAPQVAPGELPPARPASTVNERTRPKKLPCGHVLHLGCLKSWLERQQVCPTCREPVVEGTGNNARRPGRNNANPAGVGGQPPAPGQDGGAPPAPAAGRGGRGMRMLNFGPLRVGFGQANLQDLQQGIAGAQPGQNVIPPGARVYGLELGFPRRNQAQAQTQGTVPAASLQEQIQQIEQQVMADVQSLQLTQQQLQVIHLLQSELERLRQLQNGQADQGGATFVGSMAPTIGVRPPAPFTMPHMQRHGARSNTAAIPAGSADLPPGVTIPEGWSLLPLQRLEGVTQTGAIPTTSGLAPTATTTQTQTFTSPTTSISNNTPSGTQNPDIQPPSLAADSPELTATNLPRSSAPNQSANAEATFTIPDSTSSTTPLLQTPPAVLPNWGSSQLFSGPSLTGNTNNGVGTPSHDATLPSFPGGGSSGEGIPATGGASVNANVFTSEGGYSSSTAAADETSSSAEERRRAKGKAKAATVEDTVDETEAGEREESLI